MGKENETKTIEDIQVYRKDKSLKLITEYKDLIGKTFTIVEKDLLQETIDNEDEKETEQRYLDAIKKRRIALDEVDLMLDKIEKLEKNFNSDTEEEKTSTGKNWTKKVATSK